MIIEKIRYKLHNFIVKKYSLFRGYLLNEKGVFCNICGWEGGKFCDLDCGFGHTYANSTCPLCGSQPRHRSLYIYFQQKYNKNIEQRLLHFAPEKYLGNTIKKINNIKYLSVDINPAKAMQKEDITSLSFPDESFDIIICCHVLEHVENDKKAIKELYRVLKKTGFAIIDVPLDYSRDTTYEDESIRTYQARTKAFLQWDHVRLYGKDFLTRLEIAGFNVKSDNYISTLGESFIKKLGLEKNPIYYCQK